MKRAFVSYSRENSAAISQLIEDLHTVGIDAWYDQTLTGGQRWWDNILLNIRECDVFIFALSPASWESQACRSELGYVKQLGKTILPVLVADGINTNLLPFPLKEIQLTDYRRCDKEAALALVKSINTAPPAGPLPDPLPAPPKVPTSYLSDLQERIDSDEPLTDEEQRRLVYDLEKALRDGRSPAEIRDLLLKLKRRDDLLAKYARGIDELLRNLEPNTPPRPSEFVADDHQTPPHWDTNGGDRPQPMQSSIPGPGVSPANRGTKQRRYECGPNDTPAVIADLRAWLDAQGFDCQQMGTEDQGLLLQVKKRGGWREFVGMATSLNIVFRQAGNTLIVEIGAGKWIDKAAAGVASMVVLWPLALTASFGAWEQIKLPDRIFDYIGRTRLVSLAS